MTDVSVLGTGIMGSAIAKCLLGQGKTVTVWNRNADKTSTAQEAGAAVVGSAAEALEASPVSIFVIVGYDAVWDVVSGSGVDLNSFDVVNMTTGQPSEGLELAKKFEAAGGHLLESCILTYPSEIGTDGAAIKYSGDESVWTKHSATLQLLGGKTDYLGGGPQLANVMDAAVLTAYLPAITSVLEAAAFASSHGLDFASLEGPILDTVPLLQAFVGDARAKADAGDFSVQDASLAIYHAGVDGVVEAMKASNFGSFTMKATLDAMQNGLDQGRGEEDLFVLYDVMRDKPTG